MILLDTHVVVWLYQDAERLIPESTRQALDAHSLVLSPFVRLELQYLNEVGKVTVAAESIVDELAAKLEMIHSDPPSAQICTVATTLRWTRDPFDRLLSAQATATDMPLVTKDRTIRQNLPLARWDEDF
ncbi:PIN domain nuclease of toxin-antitoxin system [Haloactinopolyspora alba]|uniref:PIN domain nuclease of toxin-antitoxin system n=1 Tax=Haloactinopolyspora alba TaxID=648780 RepID=A0A2P8E3G5_9ACTN|nr:PIN domain-containing protein [Haloactinopolyspora alba]PSL04010.1 PIN domain nuclease of toxin-antitoxin system [Haloactinopolyspora alba]